MSLCDLTAGVVSLCVLTADVVSLCELTAGVVSLCELTTTTTKLVPGTEWERVAKLCDFNPKTARNTKDVGRMRSVILQLKQEGSSPSMPMNHGV